MLRKPEGCNRCPLFGNGLGFINSSGPKDSQIVVIGESGGENEAKTGKPFVSYAASGSKLDEILKLNHVGRNNVLIGNIVNCQPPKNRLENMPYEREAILHCQQHLHKIVNEQDKKVILALGKIAMRELTGFSGDSTNKESISHLRGFAIESKYGVVVPSYHPAYVKRGKPQFTEYLRRDLAYALAKKFEKPRYDFVEHPTYEVAKAFVLKVKDNPSLPLYYDIETDDSLDSEEDERQGLVSNRITRIQFSLEQGRAITFPYMEEWIKFFKILFLLPNPKVAFNSYNFDNPRLRDKGFLFNGKLIDLMWMFKHWRPGLERGLQKVASYLDYPEPWKHLAESSIEWYGCHDVNSMAHCFPQIEEGMRKEGVREGFYNHVVEFWPILDKAKSIGLPVSKEKIDRLRDDLLVERKGIFEEIQGLVPEEIKNLEPKRKEKNGIISYGFKSPPKKLILEFWQTYCDIQEQWNGRNLTTDRYRSTFDEFLLTRRFGKKETRLICKAEQREDGSWVNKWYRQAPFVPSSQQLIKYIEWKKDNLTRKGNKIGKYYNVPLVIDIKTKDLRKSTGKKALEELLERTGDDVIRLVIGDKEEDTLGGQAGIRSIDKVLKNDIVNWQPASDGAIHTTWGMVAASGQLDSRAPNILNASKHSAIGKVFRGVVEAPDGYVLVECDKKSYHVATMGYCANDANYIRFSKFAHSFFTAYIAEGILGLPTFDMSDEEIQDICNRYAKDEKWKWVRQNIAKVVVLGNQLGLGKRRILINQNPLTVDPITRRKVKPFRSLEHVASLQAMLARMFGKVERFKSEIVKTAHKAKRLVNEWGYQQQFWDAFTWKYDREMASFELVPGSEKEKAIAFPVQSVAFGDLRDKLIQLRDKGLLEIYKFINSIHDSVMFLFKKKLLDNFLADVYPILVSPSRKLIKECCPNGLVVDVEVFAGRNWREWNELKNPEGMREIKLCNGT